MKKLIYMWLLFIISSVAIPAHAMDQKNDHPNDQSKTAAGSLANSAKAAASSALDIETLLKSIDVQAPDFYQALEVIVSIESTLSIEQINNLRKIILTKYEALLRSIIKPGLDSIMLNGTVKEVPLGEIHEQTKLAVRSAEELQPIIELFKQNTKTPDKSDSYKVINTQRSVLHNYGTGHIDDNLVLTGQPSVANEKNYWHLAAYDNISMGVDLPFEGNKAIFDIAVSADGRYILAGSTDHSAYVWNRDTNKIQTLLHYGLIRCVDITPDGKYAFTGSNEGMVRIWHLDSAASRVIDSNDKHLLALQITSDAKHLFVKHAALKAKIFSLDVSDLLLDLSLTQLLLLCKLMQQPDYDNELKVTVCKNIFRTLKNYPLLKQRLRKNLAGKLIKNCLRIPNGIEQLIVGYCGEIPALKKLKISQAASLSENCVIA